MAHKRFLLSSFLLAGSLVAGACNKAPSPNDGERDAPDVHADHANHAHQAPGSTAKPGEHRVYFMAPQAGSVVFEDVFVQFGVVGKSVAKAGEHPGDSTYGHHHLIIDGGPIPAQQVVPADATHIHFGGGQSETTTRLPVGKHTLTLQFADAAHVSYGPEMATTIPIEVVQTPAALGVDFKDLKDGATVSSPLQVGFVVNGMRVVKAGESISDKTSGHHHLIIDGAPIAQGVVVPADDKHLHFGGGQTETTVTLSPGAHTLTLQFADGAHISYGPQMSKTIRIEVK